MNAETTRRLGTLPNPRARLLHGACLLMLLGMVVGWQGPLLA